jgi:UDP-N-acetylmuramate--alanine ligase
MISRAEISEWYTQCPQIPKNGRIHFVGIGGAGMSALARILLKQGREISGSDIAESETITELKSLGATIQIEHNSQNIENAAMVVVSDAVVPSKNPETQYAKENNIPLVRRSQLLGAILATKTVIAITGTHGKSTTTAVLAQILEQTNFDPLAIIGADVPGIDRNVRHGNNNLAIVEACEAFDSFHDLKPTHILLTNLEPDHLDFHKTFSKLQHSVLKFIESASGNPKLVYCYDDPGARSIGEQIKESIAYGFTGGDFVGSYHENILQTPLGNIQPGIIGRMNALNCLGALQMALLVGSPPNESVQAIKNVRGCKRRLEKVGEKNNITIYDDYAHHPTEIIASIDALRETNPNRRIITVFQPHLYSRTQDQLEGFVNALAQADIAIVTDIYPARELPIPGISSSIIVERLENRGLDPLYVPSRHLLPYKVAQITKKGDVVVGMGAGNIESFAKDFLKELEREQIRVAVFAGGISTEREVSKISGNMVANALKNKGYNVSIYDPNELLFNSKALLPLIGPERPTIAFLTLHGTGGEDGAIQGILEWLNLPYTGSGILASALATNKFATKKRLQEHGIPVPNGIIVDTPNNIQWNHFPAVVKPNSQGSTIGLSIVQEPSKLKRAVEIALKYDSQVLIEEHINGIEISVPILGNRVLPAVEIRPLSGFYDFASKYTIGATEEIAPAQITQKDADKASEYALKAHTLVQACDFSRTDMIVTNADVYVLEINTLPGLTSTSLLPKSAESIGISFEEVCEIILKSALQRYGIETPKKT